MIRLILFVLLPWLLPAQEQLQLPKWGDFGPGGNLMESGCHKFPCDYQLITGPSAPLTSTPISFHGYWLVKTHKSIVTDKDETNWYLLIEHRVVADIWLDSDGDFYRASITGIAKADLWRFDDLQTAKQEVQSSVTDDLVSGCFSPYKATSGIIINGCPTVIITDSTVLHDLLPDLHVAGDIVPLALENGELNPLLYCRNKDGKLIVISPGWVALDSINFIRTK